MRSVPDEASEPAAPEVRSRVAVAVVSYNTRERLRECLQSLGGWPIWVIDNASTDGSAALVEEEFPQVRIDARRDNLGFGAAVNRAADLAGEWDWLVVANADTAPESGAIETLLSSAEPDTGILAPKLTLPDGSIQHSCFSFWTVRSALAINLGLQHLRPGWAEERCLIGHWDPERRRRVPWAIGAFLMVRRAAWEAVGGFDRRQWLYAEDLDLGWRMHRAGWSTRYVPDARVVHAESSSIGAVWGGSKVERWMAATYEWMLRSRGGSRTRAVAAINVLGSIARGDRRWAHLHAMGLRRRAALTAMVPRPQPPEAGGRSAEANRPAASATRDASRPDVPDGSGR